MSLITRKTVGGGANQPYRGQRLRRIGDLFQQPLKPITPVKGVRIS